MTLMHVSVHIAQINTAKFNSSNKSLGIEKIPVRTIKDSLPATLPMITSLINVYFTRGVFPGSWKLAEVGVAYS